MADTTKTDMFENAKDQIINWSKSQTADGMSGPAGGRTVMNQVINRVAENSLEEEIAQILDEDLPFPAEFSEDQTASTAVAQGEAASDGTATSASLSVADELSIVGLFLMMIISSNNQTLATSGVAWSKCTIV